MGYYANVGFSPDSTSVVAVYDDGATRLFSSDLMKPIDELTEKARQLVVRIKRKPTDCELKKYLNDPLVE